MARRKAQTPGQPPELDDEDTPETPGQPLPVAAAAPSGLPNAIDIDPKAIKAPVLTNQGWVCPDETERPPRDAMKP